jgi:hypothetical protein
MESFEPDRAELLSGAEVAVDEEIAEKFSDILREYRTKLQPSRGSERSKRVKLDNYSEDDNAEASYTRIMSNLAETLDQKSPFDIVGIHSIIGLVFPPRSSK